MPKIVEPAPAKVNLFLHVGAKRADGYHDLTSLVVFPQISDEIAAEANGELSLSIGGPFADGLAVNADNLILRAAEALARGRKVPGAKIRLVKNLPIASGIGGGSTDAAATLRMLNEMWRLRLTKERLRAIGLTLGSDVPVCIDPKPQWMEGRGERVTRGPRLPAFQMVLVNPGVPVPTGSVFKALAKKSGAARPQGPKSFSSAQSLAAWLMRETRNDLETPAVQIAPPVAKVLAALSAQPECLLARMSGSGATCFGLFANTRAAKRAAAAMPKAWWAKAANTS